MDKKHFSFFESYYRSFKGLPPKVIGEIILAMGALYFEDEEVELKGLSGSVYELIKPVLESSKKKAENGAKGGSKTKAKGKQSESKTKASDKQTPSDKDKDKDKDKDINIKEGKPKFIPPTVEEVKEYCRERGNSVDAETFVDFYTAKGWKVGNNPMKDWKACVRTWEKRNNPIPEKKPVTKFSNFEERTYNFSDLEKRFARN